MSRPSSDSKMAESEPNDATDEQENLSVTSTKQPDNLYLIEVAAAGEPVDVSANVDASIISKELSMVTGVEEAEPQPLHASMISKEFSMLMADAESHPCQTPLISEKFSMAAGDMNGGMADAGIPEFTPQDNDNGSIEKPSLDQHMSPCSPIHSGNPYQIEVAASAMDTDFSADPDEKTGHTPEINMITHELSLIGRKGTMMSLFGRERSTMSSPTSRTRAGLLSRISILPAAFVAPALEMDIDPISGISLIHLSFLYKHAPSLHLVIKEVSTELVDIEDEDLQAQIEDMIREQNFLFPKDCFTDISSGTQPFANSDEPIEGVVVEVIPQHVMTNFNRSLVVNHSILSGASGNRIISTQAKSLEGEESLLLITPRAILLTPELTSSEEDLSNQQTSMWNDAGGLSPAISEATLNPVARKQQIMVCLKVVRISSKIAQSNSPLLCCDYKAAMVEDIFREVLDHRGFDFVNPQSRSSDSNLLLQRLTDDEDICIMLESMKWPILAQRWFTRDRSHWPSQELISELKTVPCHVTPFPIKDKENFKCIKRTFYSFPLVDNILFGSLTQKQCTVFTVIFVLYQKHFSEPPLLKLAHIKAVFFWACERMPSDYWKDSELSVCVFHILNQLVEALRTSTLPHYITEENLLSHACSQTVKDVAEMVRMVRKTPIKSLVNSNHFGAYDEGLCEPILTYLLGESKIWDVVSCIVITAIRISQSYLPEHGKEMAVRVLEDACRIVFQFRHFDEAAITLVHVTCDLYCDLCDLDKVIEFTENMTYIAYEYESDHLDLSLCLSRLATLYHCKAQDVVSESDIHDHVLPKYVWLQKAQEYFDLALLEDYSLIAVIHYAVYLLKQCRPKDALDQLTNAIALTDETDEATLLQETTTFTLLEVNILDDDLSLEVRVMGIVEAPTVVMGYYYLCKALLESGVTKGLEEYMIILEILAGSRANAQRHTTWALLGYIRNALKDLLGTRIAFLAALDQKIDYNVLRDRIPIIPLKKKGFAESACCVML